ncbi:MAG: DUF420 domain-containing protein [Gemmataceae bacterium]|nr:DUF420 domain-containing protein [Gemmataceae bacterium]
MSGYDLPTVNAVLNATSTVLIIGGYLAVRARRIRLHQGLMLTALATSALFLTSYLVYHFVVRSGEATRYEGEFRSVYLALLLSHTVLAAVAAPMVLATVFLALRGRIDSHRRFAKVTLPIWLYVSVTGVVIYFILKDLYPQG